MEITNVFARKTSMKLYLIHRFHVSYKVTFIANAHDELFSSHKKVMISLSGNFDFHSKRT